MALPELKVRPVLDQDFCPAYHFENYYKDLVGNSKSCEVFRFGVLRGGELLYSEELKVLVNPEQIELTNNYLEKLLRTSLWMFGGDRIIVCGNPLICEVLKVSFSPSGTRKDDIDFMERIFSSTFSFEIDPTFECKVQEFESTHSVSVDTSGERIGIDLGASSIKVCAVKDGEVVFQERNKWRPSESSNLSFHRDALMGAYRNVRQKLSSPLSVGISTAGVIIDDMVAVSSLFRGLEEVDDFRSFFKDFSKEIGIPVTVVNDGEVSALSGTLNSNKAVLGLSFGSDLGGGFIAPGRVGQWLNELAFTTVDFSDGAPIEPWANEPGTGGQYLSKKAFNRLSELASDDSEIFRTMGAYLAHTIPWFHRFYSFDAVIVMGGITQKDGGELILESAKEIFKECYPSLANRVELNFARSENRQFRQAETAAGLVRK